MTRTAARSTTTREVPERQQAIVIRRDASTNPVSYNVDRTPPVLKFKLLFLRDPRAGERDVVLGIPELQKYAAVIWR